MNKVSVIIPTCDRLHFFSFAIQSVLKQDYENFEIVVTDNSSNSLTKEFIINLKDDRIKYFKNDNNIGFVNNYNKAIDLCEGDYIHIFCDDDIMLDNCISKKVKIYDQYPNLAFIHSDINLINDAGIVTSNTHWAKACYSLWSFTHNKSKIFKSKTYLNILFYEHNIISFPSVMVSSHIIKKFNLNLNPQIILYADWLFWLQLSFHGDIYYLNEKLISYRYHFKNLTDTVTKKNKLKELYFINNIILEYCLKNNLKLKYSTKKYYLKHQISNYPIKNNFYRIIIYFKVFIYKCF